MSKHLLAVTLAAVLACTCAYAQKPLRVLYLTKSAGFEHSIVKREGDQLSYSERIMTDIVKKMGGTITCGITCTKDAGLINAENLKNYDVVIFCTTGVLTMPGTSPGTENEPLMGPNGVSDLLAWIKAGGGFIGYHNANDSFHSDGANITPYIDMLGGEFETHGPQFEGTVKPVDKGHPAIKSLTDDWKIRDEWYISMNYNTKAIHVLALLDPSIVRGKKDHEKYNIPDYPIMWCRGFDKGRVLYNAMGHREDIWDNPKFQQIVQENIAWANGKGELRAEPNYDKVVPKTIPPVKEEKKKSKWLFWKK